jgi:hypothetical protein
MAMHRKRGQGARRPHGEPCNDEQRRPRLSGALGATPAYWIVLKAIVANSPEKSSRAINLRRITFPKTSDVGARKG